MVCLSKYGEVDAGVEKVAALTTSIKGSSEDGTCRRGGNEWPASPRICSQASKCRDMVCDKYGKVCVSIYIKYLYHVCSVIST